VRLSGVWDKAGAEYRFRVLGSTPSRFLGEHGRVAGLLMRTADDLFFDSVSQNRISYWTKGRVALVGDAG